MALACATRSQRAHDREVGSSPSPRRASAHGRRPLSSPCAGDRRARLGTPLRDCPDRTAVLGTGRCDIRRSAKLVLTSFLSWRLLRDTFADARRRRQLLCGALLRARGEEARAARDSCFLGWKHGAKRLHVHLGKIASRNDDVHRVAAHACFLSWQQWVKAEVIHRSGFAELKEAEQVIVQSNAWLLKLQGENHCLEESLQLACGQVSVLTEALQHALKAKDDLVVELQESYGQMRTMLCACVAPRGSQAPPLEGALPEKGA